MSQKPEPQPHWAVFTPQELHLLLFCAQSRLQRSEPNMLKHDVTNLKSAIAKLEEARDRPAN